MITKEQAEKETNFIQTKTLTGEIELKYGSMQKIFVPDGGVKDLNPPMKWKANGKCKTWKRNPEKFQLPIKHGLYQYGYITEENAHLFEIA